MVPQGRDPVATQLPTVAIRIRVRSSDLEPVTPATAARPLLKEAIRLAASHYTERLLSDLAIRAVVNVVIEQVADDLIPEAFPFSMTIGDEPARLNLRSPRGPLYEDIPSEIYRNRSLLITRDLATISDGGSRPVQLSPATNDLRFRAMRACVDRNISLRTLLNSLGAEDLSSVADEWELVFRVHSEDVLHLSIHVHPERYRELETDSEPWRTSLLDLQRHVFETTGLLCPLPEVRRAPEIGRDEYYYRINDARLPVKGIASSWANIRSEIVQALREQLLTDAQALFTRRAVERNLDFLRESSPILTDEALRLVGLNTLCRVLEGLVREGFPPKRLGRILDILTFVRGSYSLDTSRFIVFTSDAESPVWKDDDDRPFSADDYLRCVRSGLKREITHRYAHSWQPGKQPDLRVCLLSPDVEARIQASSHKPFTEDERWQFVQAILAEEHGAPAVLLTTAELRAQVRELIRLELPDVTVLAYQDLSVDTNITPLARIDFPEVT